LAVHAPFSTFTAELLTTVDRQLVVHILNRKLKIIKS